MTQKLERRALHLPSDCATVSFLVRSPSELSVMALLSALEPHSAGALSLFLPNPTWESALQKVYPLRGPHRSWRSLAACST